MRILHLCVRFPPAPGGVERVVLSMCRELKKRGHDVEVFTSDLYSEIPWKRLDGSYLEFDGIPVRRFRAHSLKGELQYSVMPSMITAVLKGKWDIIHAHSYGFFPSHAGALGGRARRGKFVFQPHFHPGETGWGGVGRKKARGFYDDYAAGRVLSAAKAIICVSEGAKMSAVESGFPEEKISIIPNSVDISRFKGLKEDSFKERYDLGDFVLFVGRLARNKGLEHLFAAAPQVLRKFPEVKFVLIGEDEDMKDSLESQLMNLGIRDGVVFMGALEDREVSEAYKDCALFVLPSEFEAFGIVLIEAMAAGKPCVATRVGGVPDVMRDGETGILVDYGDREQLGEAISEMLGDKGKREAYGKTGRKWVEDNFTIERVVDRLERLYGTVLGGDTP